MVQLCRSFWVLCLRTLNRRIHHSLVKLQLLSSHLIYPIYPLFLRILNSRHTKVIPSILTVAHHKPHSRVLTGYRQMDKGLPTTRHLLLCWQMLEGTDLLRSKGRRCSNIRINLDSNNMCRILWSSWQGGSNDCEREDETNYSSAGHLPTLP